MHHFIAITEFKLETPTVGQKRRFLEPCDLEIWRMTLKNIRAPLLSNIKLCTSFHHHMWIDPSHRCGHPQAACHEPTGSYDKTTRAAICFEHKTQYLLIRAPYTRIVVFWHISNIPPMISQSQISCNTPTFICFEHKTQYLLIRAPYTRIVVFWHISNIPPMISQSQISCNTPTFCIAALFVKYCYTTGSWLL